MMAATYFIEECNRRSTHAGHTYGILKLKGILEFIFNVLKSSKCLILPWGQLEQKYLTKNIGYFRVISC